MNANKKRIADKAYIEELKKKCDDKPTGGSPAEKEWKQLDKLPEKKPGEKNLGILDEI